MLAKCGTDPNFDDDPQLRCSIIGNMSHVTVNTCLRLRLLMLTTVFTGPLRTRYPGAKSRR